MYRIVYAGLLLGIVLVSGCDSGGERSGAPSAPAVASSDLKAAVSDAQTKAFYEKRNWAPAWSRKDEQALKAVIDARAGHGLDRLDYWPEPGGQQPAAREAMLTQAALRYADALARGAADPTKLHELYELKRPATDVAAGLQQALASGDVTGWLNGLAPQDEGYKAL